MKNIESELRKALNEASDTMKAALQKIEELRAENKSLKEASKLALEALVDTQRYGYFVQHSSLPQRINNAVRAIEETLVQPSGSVEQRNDSEQQEPVACPYCKNSATLGSVYYDQNCVGCVKRMVTPPQPEHEPAFYIVEMELEALRRDGRRAMVLYTKPITNGIEVPVYTAPPQPKQEPVAWFDGPHLVMREDWRDRSNYKGPYVGAGRVIPDSWVPVLYTTPPQKTWAGLTDEEINYLVQSTPYEDDRLLVEKTEALLKEKNT